MRPEPLPLIQHKRDVENARKLIKLGYPAVAPVLPYMLEWLKDLNWPVARELFDFLAAIGEPLIPEIRRVFATDDDVWKYWCLTLLRAMPSEVVELMREDLLLFVTFPLPGERSEKVVLVSQQLLDEMNA